MLDIVWSGESDFIGQAKKLYHLNKYEEALGLLNIAIAEEGFKGSLYFNKALIHHRQNNFSAAVEALDEAIELNGEDPEILTFKGISYLRNGEYAKAEKTFDNIRPDYEPGYCPRIILYSLTGKPEKAKEMYYTARQYKEFCAHCQYNIAKALFDSGHYEAALSNFLEIKNNNKDNNFFDFKIGQVYWVLGNSHEAEKYFRAYAEKGNTEDDFLMSYALLLLEMNNTEAAKSKLSTVISQYPEHSQAHHILGEISLLERKIGEAVDFFKAASITPYDRQLTNFMLGKCYFEKREFELAKKYLTSVGSQYRGMEVLIDVGAMLYSIGAIIAANNTFETISKHMESDTRVLNDIGCCQFSTGSFDESIVYFEDALWFDPNNLAARENLIRVHISNDQFSLARHEIEEVIKRAQMNESIEKMRKIALNERKDIRYNIEMQIQFGDVPHFLLRDNSGQHPISCAYNHDLKFIVEHPEWRDSEIQLHL